MYCKFITLVVFAYLTRISCHAEEQVLNTEYNDIVNKQKSTIQVTKSAINVVFDTLQSAYYKKINNLQCQCVNTAQLTPVGEALANSKTATDNEFAAISILLGGSSAVSPAFEAARTASQDDLENIFTQIGNAIASVNYGNCTDIKAEIAPFFTASNVSLTRYVTRLYDTLRTTLNINDAETLATIKSREKVSNENMDRLNYYVFDAIKVFGSVIPISSITGVVPDISDYRQAALAALQDDVEQFFGIIRGLYLSIRHNQPGLASRYIAAEDAHIVSNSKYMEGTELLFNVFKDYLIKVKLGINDDQERDNRVFDVAERKTVGYMKSGLHAIVESVPAKNPITLTAAKAALKVFDTFADTAAPAFYSGVRLALTTGSSLAVTLVKIEAAKMAFAASVPTLLLTIFTSLRLGSLQTQAESSENQDKALQAAYSYIDCAFNASEILAKARQGDKGVSEADFVALENAKNGAISAVDKFTLHIANDYVLAVKTLNVIQDVIPTVPSLGLDVTNVREGDGGGLNLPKVKSGIVSRLG